MERQIEREKERQRVRETERQRDGETERQRDRETERQRDRDGYRHFRIKHRNLVFLELNRPVLLSMHKPNTECPVRKNVMKTKLRFVNSLS